MRRRCMKATRLVAALSLVVAQWAGGVARADVWTNVPAAETAGMQIAYQLSIPLTGNWNNVAVPYSIDNTGSIANGSFDRVAYYMELDGSWVYASFDAAGFTNDASKIGVPNAASGEFYHYPSGSAADATISNMNVYSNVASIVTGNGISTGNIEFWATNYGGGNDYGVPGANGGNFDFGDGGAGGRGRRLRLDAGPQLRRRPDAVRLQPLERRLDEQSGHRQPSGRQRPAGLDVQR